MCPISVLQPRRRASPDIAAPGHNFVTIIKGHLYLMDGSSASSPAFAGLISLLNAELKRMGKPPLGLLNPWLYQVSTVQPDAFEDIIFGNTYSDENFQCKFGYVARPGWDQMTGLGIPRFEVLRKYLPSLARVWTETNVHSQCQT